MTSLLRDEEAGASESLPLLRERHGKPGEKARRFLVAHRWSISGACALLLFMVGVMCKFGKQAHFYEGSPLPPTPYEYGSFLKWFSSVDWNSLDYPITPNRSWFDAEAAIQAHPLWFRGEDMATPLKAAHAMNRYSFMEDIMKTGDDSMQSSLASHLLFLSLLHDGLLRQQVPYTVALDVGCGNGVLLRLMALLANHSGSIIKPVGFDIRGDNVEEAKRLLAAEEARAPGPPNASVFEADVFDTAAVRSGLEGAGVKFAEDGTYFNEHGLQVQVSGKPVVDVIVVSSGVLGSKAGSKLSRDEEALELTKEQPLKDLVDLLKLEGFLLFPMCKEQTVTTGADGVVRTNCEATSILLRKDTTGHVTVVRGGQYDKDFSGTYPTLTSDDLHSAKYNARVAAT